MRPKAIARTLLRGVALAICLAACAAMAPAQTARSRAGGRPGARTRPSVLLITVDTVRADHLGCYGYRDIKTPAIDGLCRDSIVFEHAISQVPLTWPSHVAILTGTYPFWNGVQDFTGQPLRPGVATLAEALKRHGYNTGAVVSSFVLDRSFGVARGFDYYHDAFKGSTFLEKDIGLVDRKADESVDRALEWLKSGQPAKTGRPFFFWLHLYDPHSPYDPPEPFRSEYRDHLYDGEIAYADSQLDRVFRWLKAAGLYDSTLIVLASDHGESLGEHGEKEHGFFIYQSTARVPLLVKPPQASGLKARRESAPAETLAIPPTILKLLGVRDDIETQFQASDLLGHDAAPAYAETFYPFSSFGWSPLHTLMSAQYQYIEAPQPELYDLPSDPGEQHNLVNERPAVAAVLKQQLDDRLRRYALAGPASGGSSTDPEAAAKLRALGYLAYHAPVSTATLGAPLADPKTKLPEFNLILEGTDAMHVGEVERGELLLSKVRAEDPQMYLVPFLLGEAAMRRGDATTAATELRKALELNPNFDQAMTGLARALHVLGSDDDARKWLDKALESNPQNYRAWYQSAALEMKRDPAKAVAALEKTLAIQPGFGFAHRDLGIMQVQAQDYAAAGKHLARAVELGVEEATLFNFLGIAYVHTERVAAGIKSYRRALQLDPRLPEAHLNLAAALQKAGRGAEARPEYEAACRLRNDFCKYAPSR